MGAEYTPAPLPVTAPDLETLRKSDTLALALHAGYYGPDGVLRCRAHSCAGEDGQGLSMATLALPHRHPSDEERFHLASHLLDQVPGLGFTRWHAHETMTDAVASLVEEVQVVLDGGLDDGKGHPLEVLSDAHLAVVRDWITGRLEATRNPAGL